MVESTEKPSEAARDAGLRDQRRKTHFYVPSMAHICSRLWMPRQFPHHSGKVSSPSGRVEVVMIWPECLPS